MTDIDTQGRGSRTELEDGPQAPNWDHPLPPPSAGSLHNPVDPAITTVLPCSGGLD